MDYKKAIHYLCSLDEQVFIKWYNDYVVDPYGDFSYATIRRNDPNEISLAMAERFTPMELKAILTEPATHYDECDDYAVFASELVSFNTVEELFERMPYCAESAGEIYLQCIEDDPDVLKGYMND